MKTAKYLLFLLFYIFTAHGLAQVIKYSYDEAGNRTKREIVFKKSAETTPDSLNQTKPVTEWMKDMKITVYPNPTRGQLTVEITNLPEDVPGEVAIYGLEGRLLQHQKVLNTSSPFDLSAYPAGIYILRIQVGPHRNEWKIVKE